MDFVTNHEFSQLIKTLLPWNLQLVITKILKQISCLFHTKLSANFHYTKLQKNKLSPICFLLNSPSHILAK